jgi:fibrillarin-like rRNA methylase
LAAAIHKGGLTPALEGLFTSGPVLYLGAASGTTVSHVADAVAPEAVFAVESAGRSFGDLLTKLKTWPNVFPLHADARTPSSYAALVGTAGCLVQDVAQPDQVAIVTANAEALLRPRAPAALFVKARSVDSAAEPGRIFAAARKALQGAGFSVEEERSLEPFDVDHRAFFLRGPA